MLIAPKLRRSRRNCPGRNISSLARRRGATAVEMAFVAPFIFLLVFAAVEFSRVVMIKQALTNAAREGCRTASLATTQDSADCEYACRYYLRHCISGHDNPKKVSVTIIPGTNMQALNSGMEVTTRVEVAFSDVSWLAAFFADDLVLEGTATMKRE